MKPFVNLSPRPLLRQVALAITLMMLAGIPPKLWGMELPATPKPMKVVFFTDIHARTEWDTPKAMKQAADSITAQQADLVICGGDMITEGYQSSAAMAAPRWAAYRTMRNTIHPKPVEVLGNHDLVGVEPSDGSPPVDDPRSQFREQLGLSQTYRSFDRNGYHFILLDSVEITKDKLKYRGFIGPEQMDWLRRDLARVKTNTPIVLVSHIPLVSDVSQITNSSKRPVSTTHCVVNNREVLAAFEDHHLLVVLQGHLHINKVIRWQNTTFITGGSVCGKWWHGPRKGTPEGFGVLQLYPNHVEWKYHPYGWIPQRPAGL